MADVPRRTGVSVRSIEYLRNETVLNSSLDSTNDENQPSVPDLTLDQLPDRLREAVARAGWTTLMPVQARAIPYLLGSAALCVPAGRWQLG